MNIIHLIYSTKNRERFLTPEIRPETQTTGLCYFALSGLVDFAAH